MSAPNGLFGARLPPVQDRYHAVPRAWSRRRDLTGPAFEPIIEPTVSALRDLAQEIVVPAHCTGWRAQYRLGVELPDAYIPNAVGTSVTLAAA